MADFFLCCFPSARKRHADQDEIELVSAAALPAARRKRHMDHVPELTAPPVTIQSSDPHSYRRHHLSEHVQDVAGNETQQDDINGVAFSVFDRAHGHVLRDLDSALEHFRYAVSGSYAESLWACRRGKRRNISLFAISPNDDNVLQYQGDLMGAEPVSVRIRWISDRELQHSQIIESTFKFREGPFQPVDTTRLVLLSLPALADNIAWSWVNARSQRAREDFAADMFSVLERIIDLDFSYEGSGPLSMEENVQILGREFWVPFTKTYPQAPALFAQCGAPLPDFSLQPQPDEQVLDMPPPALRPGSFQKPRSAPTPPSRSRDHGRSLTTPSSSSSKPPSTSKKLASIKHRKPSSSSKSKPPSVKSKPKTARLLFQPSPQRPVHPANIIKPDAEPRSTISALFGLQESPETAARRRREQLEKDRAARRASEKLAAKIQRNRERDREREWHTRKQAERMDLHEPPSHPNSRHQYQESHLVSNR